MTKLTEPQIALLNAAVVADGAEAAPQTAKSAAALIRRELLISLPRLKAPSRLIITAAGREAIGLPPEPSPEKQKAAPAGGAPVAQPATSDGPKGKLGVVVAMLRRPEGATIEQLSAATSWQAHSVRGAIAGSVKKKLGLTVSSTNNESGRVYRIEAGAGA